MPSNVIDYSQTDDPRDVVHRAVQALHEGKVVAFPTETVYGLAANAASEAAIQRLLDVKQRKPDAPFSLTIGGQVESLEFVPDMPPLVERFTRRCWPGPVTVVLDATHPDSTIHRLPEAARQAVAPAGTVGLRVPDHELIREVMKLAAHPIALTSANRSGQPDAMSGQQVIEALGDDVDLILDDGESKYAQPSSVVKVDADEVTVLREGVLSAAAMQRFKHFLALVVCTGNTCRSPMGELLLQKRIADKLNCSIAELDQYGVMVMSAGVAAMAGGPASIESIEAMRQLGLDLSRHESQPVTERLVRFADLILTMTQAHRNAIVSTWPEAESRTWMLCRDQSSVSDPIGGPLESYVRCGEQIANHLDQWVEQMTFTSIPLVKLGA